MRCIEGVEVADRQPWFCSGCPHNTSAPRCRGARAPWRHRLPLHGDLDGPRHRRLHPDGRRGVPWSARQPFTSDQHTCSPTSATAPISTAALLAVRQSIAAGREHHLQDPVQRRGRDDRRPAVGERPEAFVVQIAQSMRGRGRGRSPSSPTSRKSTTARRLPGGIDPGDPPPRHAGRAARVPRDQGHHRHHLRPDLRHRKRRRRKRGTWWTRPRVVINELGARAAATGGVQSNCLSVEPLETEFGRKRPSTRAPATRTFPA